MGKRIVVCMLWLPMAAFTVFVWIPLHYIRTGELSEAPMDRLTGWAK